MFSRSSSSHKKTELNILMNKLFQSKELKQDTQRKHRGPSPLKFNFFITCASGIASAYHIDNTGAVKLWIKLVRPFLSTNVGWLTKSVSSYNRSLFCQSISGTRVVVKTKVKKIFCPTAQEGKISFHKLKLLEFTTFSNLGTVAYFLFTPLFSHENQKLQPHTSVMGTNDTPCPTTTWLNTTVDSSSKLGL